MISESQLQACKRVLEQRFYALREEIREELLQSDEQPFIELAGKVHDIPDQSVAEVLVDLDHASIQRHVDEIRAIDAALLRIATGSYGTCSDCGATIAHERLQAYPTAERCHACQARYEQGHAQAGHHSL